MGERMALGVCVCVVVQMRKVLVAGWLFCLFSKSVQRNSNSATPATSTVRPWPINCLGCMLLYVVHRMRCLVRCALRSVLFCSGTCTFSFSLPHFALYLVSQSSPLPHFLSTHTHIHTYTFSGSILSSRVIASTALKAVRMGSDLAWKQLKKVNYEIIQ
ncbi:MAG: hypothetical protein J3R72DRAFT_245343 [Linnemannia gamsii]|nr:MAG: hypothetical protein J3R72DRAFT_245343 [Linnemannia gamsii]